MKSDKVKREKGNRIKYAVSVNSDSERKKNNRINTCCNLEFVEKCLHSGIGVHGGVHGLGLFRYRLWNSSLNSKECCRSSAPTQENSSLVPSYPAHQT